jgi:hypothetical protein
MTRTGRILQPFMRAAGLTGCLLFAMAPLGVSVRAQATPEVPKPEECRVAPHSLPLLGEPAPSAPVATPGPFPTAAPFVLPAGKEADAATVDAVTATVREAIACRNAGDFARAYALMTDHMLRQLFGGPTTIDPEITSALATAPRRVSKERRLALVAISEVRVLADGRVGAVVETGSGETAYRDYIFFAAAGDRWLIDETVPLPENTTPTPTA